VPGACKNKTGHGTWKKKQDFSLFWRGTVGMMTEGCLDEWEIKAGGGILVSSMCLGPGTSIQHYESWRLGFRGRGKGWSQSLPIYHQKLVTQKI
jgi:hypothetical protein